MKKAKPNLLDKTVHVVLWASVECPHCNRVHNRTTEEDDVIKCVSCRKKFKIDWENPTMK